MEERIKAFLKEEGVVLPKGFVSEVYGQLLKFAGALSGLVQRGSKEAGKKAARALREYVPEVDGDTIKQVVTIFFKETGFGDIEVEFSGGKMVVVVKESFLLDAHKDPEKALRPLVGALEGFVEELLDSKVVSRSEGNTIELNVK